MLKGRHKDGISGERYFVRVTHSVGHFSRIMEELVNLAQDGERIYGSAGERSMKAAIREFKRRQLDADYDDDPERFYRAINDRWVASLMAPTSQQEKLWLFDCDTSDEIARVTAELREHYDRPMEPYRYATKTGWHLVVQPFDRTKISEESRKLIHENPIILWAY